MSIYHHNQVFATGDKTNHSNDNGSTTLRETATPTFLLHIALLDLCYGNPTQTVHTHKADDFCRVNICRGSSNVYAGQTLGFSTEVARCLVSH